MDTKLLTAYGTIINRMSSFPQEELEDVERCAILTEGFVDDYSLNDVELNEEESRIVFNKVTFYYDVIHGRVGVWSQTPLCAPLRASGGRPLILGSLRPSCPF